MQHIKAKHLLIGIGGPIGCWAFALIRMFMLNERLDMLIVLAGVLCVPVAAFICWGDSKKAEATVDKIKKHGKGSTTHVSVTGVDSLDLNNTGDMAVSEGGDATINK